MAFLGQAHRKQFIIANKEHLAASAIPSRFNEVQLGFGSILSYCPDLCVRHVKNTNNEDVVLIGDVVEADVNKDAPEQRLTNVTPDSIDETTKTWTGHWLLIVGSELYGDCLGLFSVYLPRKELLESSKKIAISNSPALMQRFYDLPNLQEEVKTFQPLALAPNCFRPELRTLMAAEVLELTTCARRFSQVTPFRVYENLTQSEIRERVIALLQTAVRRLQERSKDPITCALSGGYDSRLNFALASCTNIPFKSYTFVKNYFYISESDRLLPPKVAAALGLDDHEMIRGKSPDKDRARNYLAHSGGSVSTYPGNGFDHYVHRYWEQAGEGRFALDGQCYEIAVNYYERKFSPDFSMEDVQNFGFGTTPEDFEELEAHWTTLRKKGYPFDRRDLLFWSGNINGVYARMIQKHDLFVNLFFPACNREQISLLMSVPVDARGDCKFEKTIIESIRPELKDILYNPPEPTSKRIIKRLRNTLMKKLSF